MGVHGHYYTMNMKFRKEVNIEWWDKLATNIREYNVHFLVGDFNMSLTEVVPQLRARGLTIDTCSWYPWLHEEERIGGYCLGMDSCAIFYIGGDVQVEMPWDNRWVGDILTAAARLPQEPQSLVQRGFDTYSGQNLPGQIWSCYKSKKNEKLNDVTLEKKLRDLLAPSTSRDRLDELTTTAQNKKVSFLPAYLRLKQKSLDKKEWIVDKDTGELHNGAHFPLFMVTNNSGQRSKEAQARRTEQHPIAKQSWAKNGSTKTAVAASAQWWMTAESEGTPAWLEKRKAERDATCAMIQQRASDAGEGSDADEGSVEVAVVEDVAAPNDKHRHWRRSQWDWKCDQSWSDWDWYGSHREWKHDHGW